MKESLVFFAIALVLVTISFAPAAWAMGEKPAQAEQAGKGNCIVGGCSGQLCSDATQGPAMSTCEWRESYACYGKHSECQRQSDGQCGWMPTDALKQCLSTSK